MNPPKYDWHLPQRQAAAGLLIIIYKAVVTIIKTLWPLLAVLLFRKGGKGLDTFELVLIGLPFFILVRSVIDFYYFHFYVADGELIIKKGFISRKTITIPLGKIQAVHMEQNLLHQLLDVYKVKIDTAGSEKTEAVIDALQKRKAEQLKIFLLPEQEPAGNITGSGAVGYKAAQPLPVIQLSATDLLKMGITANHIQAFFIVLAFAISVLRNVQDVLGDEAIRSLERTTFVSRLIASIPLLLLLVFIVTVVVSLVTIVLNYFGFSLAETPQGYKLKTGLLNTRQFLVPFSKIQYISWEANWLRRKIGMYNLEFHQVAGEKLKEKQRVKVPVARASYIDKLLSHYNTTIRESAHSVHTLHKVYPWRRVLLAGILPVAFLLLVKWPSGIEYWMWLILLWIPFIYLSAFFFRKNFRLYIAPDVLQVYSGVWGRSNKLVKWYKIQQVELQQSVYQRRKKLATVKLATAGGTIRIPYISLELAQVIRNYALYEIERSARPWL